MTSDGLNSAPDPSSLEDILGDLPDGAPVTRLLIALNVGVFVVMIATGVHILFPTQESLLAWGGNFGPRTLQGEWWRLLTCTFIHGGIVHLAANMYGIWTLGDLVEPMVGSASFLALYLLSALLGSTVSLAVHPLDVGGGASGAMFGILGALIGLLLRRRSDFASMPALRRIWIIATVLVVVNLVAGLFIEVVDVAAHVGGLIAGFACGLALSQPLTAAALQGRGVRTIRVAVAGAAGLVALLAVLPREVSGAEDQFALARLYEHGRLLPRDETKAAEWYRRAAEQRFVPAQHQLALLYEAGRGVAKDEAAAARWFALAAEGGDADAQFKTGLRLAEGRSVQQNDVEAVRWYRRAADQGHAAAQHALGFMYGRGRGVPRDDAESARWIRLAADQQFAIAEHDMGARYATGLGVERNDSEAVRWYRRAAEQQYAPAEQALGLMYLEGRGVAKDEEEGYRWIRLAAERNNAAAAYMLGARYATGQGVPVDDSQALLWFRRAAEQGDPRGQLEWGRALGSGRAGDTNEVEAFAWYRRGADQNYAPAQLAVGLAYLRGIGTTRNAAEARAWVERAALQQYPPAVALLAEMHATGNGVPVNNAEAMRLYRTAASQGFPPAQAALALMYATGRSGSASPDYVQAYVWLAVAQIDDRRVAENRDKIAARLTPDQLQLAKARIAACQASKFQDCGDPVRSSGP